MHATFVHKFASFFLQNADQYFLLLPHHHNGTDHLQLSHQSCVFLVVFFMFGLSGILEVRNPFAVNLTTEVKLSLKDLLCLNKSQPQTGVKKKLWLIPTQSFPPLPILLHMCARVLRLYDVSHVVEVRKNTGLEVSCISSNRYSLSLCLSLSLSHTHTHARTHAHTHKAHIPAVGYHGCRNHDPLCRELRTIKDYLYIASSRSEYSSARFSYCRKVCLASICLPCLFKFIFPKSSLNIK